MDAGRERRAKNEALFREVNERIEELSSRFGSSDHDLSLTGYVCECSREDCTEHLQVDYLQYEAVRADPPRFVLASGHEDLEVDRVVERHAGFVVVEKRPEVADIAIDDDPRSPSA